MNIYVGNIAHSMTEDSLKEVFAQYGTVNSARIITDKFTGRPRGFAFVEMSSSQEAQAAIDALNNTMVEGRTIRVNEARQREERPSRPSGGYRSGGNRFGNR